MTTPRAAPWRSRQRGAFSRRWARSTASRRRQPARSSASARSAACIAKTDRFELRIPTSGFVAGRQGRARRPRRRRAGPGPGRSGRRLAAADTACRRDRVSSGARPAEADGKPAEERIGWGTWIRTRTARSRAVSSTVKLSPNGGAPGRRRTARLVWERCAACQALGRWAALRPGSAELLDRPPIAL